jgi:flagellar motor switch protein FliM
MSEVLSQGEVDALLRGVGDGEIETETDEAAEEVSGAVNYDLTSQEKIIRGRMPTLDIINQMFSRLFRNTFSALMRKPVDIRAVSTDTIKFGDFLRSLPVPSSLHIFRMEPLRGHGLIVLENKLVFSVVDTFFGGSGDKEAKITDRDFSAIEIKMTKSVVLGALDDWENAWTMTICLPYAAIESIIPKLKAQFQSEEEEVDHVWVDSLRAELLTTEVELVAELGTTIITPEDLMGFKVGDTLMLGNDVSDPLILKVEHNPKFKGFPGVSRGNKAIQITETIEREG